MVRLKETCQFMAGYFDSFLLLNELGSTSQLVFGLGSLKPWSSYAICTKYILRTPMKIYNPLPRHLALETSPKYQTPKHKNTTHQYKELIVNTIDHNC